VEVAAWVQEEPRRTDQRPPMLVLASALSRNQTTENAGEYLALVQKRTDLLGLALAEASRTVDCTHPALRTAVAAAAVAVRT
jgi:hypothetical protein